MAFTQKERPNIFLGTHEVAGHSTNVELGFRKLGLKCRRLTMNAHRFAYSSPNLLERYCRYLRETYPQLDENARLDRLRKRHTESFERGLLKRAIERYDVFIFGFMTSLDGCLTRNGSLADLADLHNANKTIICVFHGSDVRARWMNGSSLGKELSSVRNQCRKQRRRIDIIEKYADVIVSHPPMSMLQRKAYADYLSVGIPLLPIVTNRLSKPVAPYRKGSTVTRILHAPSNPKGKGTPRISQVIDRLRAEGHLIEFVIIEDMPHARVQTELAQADFLLDQIYSDTPMARLAAEAAMHGIPSVVCGLDLKELRQSFSEEVWPPSCVGAPEDLYDLVRMLIENPSETRKRGAAAKKYVSSNWRADCVARRFLTLARGEAPAEWMRDPKDPPYFLGGWGMSRSDRDSLVSSYVSEYGENALETDEDKLKVIMKDGEVYKNTL